jgi:hypothetical protein
MADQSREEIDAKIARAKAETSVDIARLESKIDNLSAMIGARFDNVAKEVDRARDEVKDSRLVTIATIVASAFAVAGVIVAMGLYGDAMFGRGMTSAEFARTVAKETADALKVSPK